MSVQMSQVLPLTKDKASNSDFKLAFLAKTDSCIESWSDWRKSVLQKFRGEVTSARSFCVENCCVCACVCVYH